MFGCLDGRIDGWVDIVRLVKLAAGVTSYTRRSAREGLGRVTTTTVRNDIGTGSDSFANMLITMVVMVTVNVT